jgi:hypothetical protein
MTFIGCLAGFAVAAAVVGLSACDGLTGKEDGADTSGSGDGGCIVSATPGEIEAGDGVTIAPDSTTVWDEVAAISVDDETLTEASPSLVINPTFTRTYAVVATRKDGKAQSCTLKVTVKDTTELGCTLSASPTSVTKGTATDVSATLQVLGTADVAKTSIDGVDLGSQVGGSKTFQVSGAMVITGRVEASDGNFATCSFAVEETGGSVAAGDCTKVEADEADLAKLSEEQTKLNVTNKAALDGILAGAKPDGATKLETNEYTAHDVTLSNNGNELTDDCKTVAAGLGAMDGVTCSQGEIKDLGNGLKYVYLERDGKHYDVYATSNYTFQFYIFAVGDTATPVIVRKTVVNKTAIPLELCECDPSAVAGSDADSSEGLMAPPPILFVERADAAPASYEGVDVHEYEEGRAYFDTNYVEPEAGKAKPACPIQEHVDT